MTESIKYMDLNEFREAGYLQEGMIFGDLSDEDSAAKAATVQAEYERHAAKRTELFGVIEQPIGSVVPPLDVASQS